MASQHRKDFDRTHYYDPNEAPYKARGVHRRGTSLERRGTNPASRMLRFAAKTYQYIRTHGLSPRLSGVPAMLHELECSARHIRNRDFYPEETLVAAKLQHILDDDMFSPKVRGYDQLDYREKESIRQRKQEIQKRLDAVVATLAEREVALLSVHHQGIEALSLATARHSMRQLDAWIDLARMCLRKNDERRAYRALRWFADAEYTYESKLVQDADDTNLPRLNSILIQGDLDSRVYAPTFFSGDSDVIVKEYPAHMYHDGRQESDLLMRLGKRSLTIDNREVKITLPQVRHVQRPTKPEDDFSYVLTSTLPGEPLMNLEARGVDHGAMELVIDASTTLCKAMRDVSGLGRDRMRHDYATDNLNKGIIELLGTAMPDVTGENLQVNLAAFGARLDGLLRRTPDYLFGGNLSNTPRNWILTTTKGTWDCDYDKDVQVGRIDIKPAARCLVWDMVSLLYYAKKPSYRTRDDTALVYRGVANMLADELPAAKSLGRAFAGNPKRDEMPVAALDALMRRYDRNWGIKELDALTDNILVAYMLRRLVSSWKPVITYRQAVVDAIPPALRDMGITDPDQNIDEAMAWKVSELYDDCRISLHVPVAKAGDLRLARGIGYMESYRDMLRDCNHFWREALSHSWRIGETGVSEALRTAFADRFPYHQYRLDQDTVTRSLNEDVERALAYRRSLKSPRSP